MDCWVRADPLKHWHTYKSPGGLRKMPVLIYMPGVKPEIQHFQQAPWCCQWQTRSNRNFETSGLLVSWQSRLACVAPDHVTFDHHHAQPGFLSYLQWILRHSFLSSLAGTHISSQFKALETSLPFNPSGLVCEWSLCCHSTMVSILTKTHVSLPWKTVNSTVSKIMLKWIPLET